MKFLTTTPNFLDGSELTDDELVDLASNETFMRGDALYKFWRRDSAGNPWFMRLGAIKADSAGERAIAAADAELIDSINDDADADDPIECHWTFDDDDDDTIFGVAPGNSIDSADDHIEWIDDDDDD